MINILKKKGFPGLYQGGIATLYRDVIFSAVYFPVFAIANKSVKKIDLLIEL